ncbi:Type I restriction modification DNA specificity domain-containing protein [Actinomadura madurae]|uniref:Type I restriction modification DNA specificity domain-containing protein n=2 Tax=Actinomadura madurae TaxID=1993 RepID=A0A1I5U589_9ACTN|nr:Type I restriction modification DNA specificity domain-containing protein [Actinomadura madurae]
MTGSAGQRRVPENFFADLEIPLPPLENQSQIAKALDRADSLRGKRRAAIALLDELAQSVFLDMFGAPASDWPVFSVDEIAAPEKGAIRTGPFGSQLLHEEFVDSGVSVLGIDNAVANEFRWGKSRFITPEKYKQLSRYTVKPGDVLITIMGTCGRCAIVPDDIPTAINTKHLCCITLDRERCLPEFLHSYFLLHPRAQSYLHKAAKGAIMSGLNMSIIKALPLHLPPIELQQDYADSLRGIQRLKASHASHLRKLDDLFGSLQQRAFRGELWDA